MKFPRALFFSMLLLFLSFSAHAASFTINANSAPYSSHQSSTGVGLNSDLAELQSAMFSLISVHNTINPTNKIEPGDLVTFKWKDGSSQKAKVTSLFSPSGVAPIEGTQSMPEGGGPGYTTGPGGNSLGGVGVIGFTPIYTTVQICIGTYCWQSTVVSGYQYIYGNIGPRDRVV